MPEQPVAKKFHLGKKHIVLLAVIAAVLVVGTILAFTLGSHSSTPTGNANYTRTVTLSKTALTDTVSVTGTVESNSVTNITSTANYKVKEILVQEGDSVIEGQTLATLDTEDLEDQIAKAQKSQSTSITDAQDAYNKAVTNRDEAYNKSIEAESTINSAKTALDAAYAPYIKAKESIAACQANYDASLTADQNAGVALNNANATKEHYVYERAAAGTEDNTWVDSQGHDYYYYEKACTDATTAKAATEATLAVNKTDLDTAKMNSNFDALERTYTAAQTAYDQARTALDNAENTYKNALDSVDSAQKQLDNARDADTLEDLQKQLEDCTITSTTAGTITTVNATVGNTAASSAGGALFVIQNTDNLKISVVIDEYDIKKITTGMRAIIQSDATGDTEIAGHVSQISLTASGTGDAAGFGAEITVDSADSGLLIGMNASVTIVLSESDATFNVPIDSVGTDDNGNSVIYVQQDNGTFEPLTITTGKETDYYVEIYGSELTEGMIVRYSADESSITAATDTTDIMGFGGMGGMGDMTMTTGGDADGNRGGNMGGERPGDMGGNG